MPDLDAIIVGAGPAGCAAAIPLARAGHRVLLLEHRQVPRFNIGETLPPMALGCAERLLGPLGAALADCSYETRGNISIWGHESPAIQDFFFSPDGCGLCLDRGGFDHALRQAAEGAGAHLRSGAKVLECRWDAEKNQWAVSYQIGQQHHEANGSFLLDATGRRGEIARGLGMHYTTTDALFAFAMSFGTTADTDNDRFTRIEACPFGWWYSNALPGRSGERIVVLHTDRDLPEAALARTPDGFLRLLGQSTMIREHLAANGYGPMTSKLRGAAAGSDFLDGPQPEAFFAVGDAAQSLDPLSSQGLYQALQSGSLAASNIRLALARNQSEAATTHFRQMQSQVRAKYLREYCHFYEAERRWIQAPFWARRHRRTANIFQGSARDALV
ncbi:tryptophan 7-halogenase [Primorskyibacter sp. 2E233]|uniref:tryptophan 7-halogenase n=1 Tax=Primorskyibacter sp. 2E233 TaxID=3413431 RepID=UPI003BEF6272